MAVTVEELQIVIKTSLQDSLKSLAELERRLDRVRGQAEAVQQKTAAATRNAASVMRKAADQTVQAVQKQADAYGDLDAVVKRALEREQAQRRGGSYEQKKVALGPYRMASDAPKSAGKSVSEKNAKTLERAQKIVEKLRKETQLTDGQLQKLAFAAGKAGEAAYGAYDKARQAVEKTRVSMGALEREMGNIARQKSADLSGFYREPAQLDAAVGKALEADGAYQKLGARFDAMAVKLQQYQDQLRRARQALAELTAESARAEISQSRALVPVQQPGLPAPLPETDSKAGSGWLGKLKTVISTVVTAAKSGFKKVAGAVDEVGNSTEFARRSAKKYGDQVRKTTGKAKTLFLSLGRAIRNFLTMAVLYRGFSALFAFLRNGIQSAINAPEIENLFRVALGNMADEAAAFAKKFRDALGVDEYVTKNMLGTFQNMITAMGIGQRTAYKMSKSLTILSQDMASLFNMDPQQVFENLQSAMSGQSEAVRKYGMVVNEAAIKQTALKYGIVSQGQALTEQQKVLARYLTILEQSKNAQGDLANTFWSVGNQIRAFRANIAAAGRAIGEAFLPFLQAVLPWLNALAVLLQRAGNAFARFTYGLFGMDYDAEKQKQQQVIGGFGGVADAVGEAGDAAKEAGDKAKGALAPFDELNVIQQPAAESGGTGTSGGGGLEMPGIPELDIPDMENPYDKLADEIMQKLRDIFSVFRLAWENEGQATIDAAKHALEGLKAAAKAVAESFAEVWNNGTGQEFVENLLRLLQLVLNIVGDLGETFAEAWRKGEAGTALIQSWFDKWNAIIDLIRSVGEAFRTVWNNGTGVEIWSTILSILTNIQNIVENLADRLRVAWEANDNGVKIWQHILDMAQHVLDFFDRVTAATAEWAAGLDFEPLVSAFERLLAVMEPLVASICDGLGWAWENILLPFGTWVVETAAPAFLDAVAAVLASPVWENCGAAIKDLYENALLPLARWAGEKFLEFLQWIQDNGDTVAAIVAGIGAAILTWMALQGVISLLSSIKSAIALVANPVGLVAAAVGALVAIIALLITHWDDVKEAASNAWEGIKGKWQDAKNWFSEHVSGPIVETFSGLWEGIKTKTAEGFAAFQQNWSTGWKLANAVCAAAWNGVKTACSNAVSAIKTSISNFISGVKTAWSNGWNAVKNTFSNIWNSIKSTASSVVRSIKGTITGLIDRVKEAIDRVKEFFGFKSKADNADYDDYDVGESRRKSVRVAYAVPEIPEMARGGVLRQRQLFVGGEYPGAASNPEIVSPASLMYETVAEANAPMVLALCEKLDQLIQAVRENGVEISADAKGIFKAVQKEAGRFSRVTGAAAF